MNTITLTYKVKKENKGYSVLCLDSDSIFTQGDSYQEMMKNIIEVSEWWLQMERDGELHPNQHIKIKKHGHSKNYFTLVFDTLTCKQIKEKNFKYLNMEKPAIEQKVIGKVKSTTIKHEDYVRKELENPEFREGFIDYLKEMKLPKWRREIYLDQYGIKL